MFHIGRGSSLAGRAGRELVPAWLPGLSYGIVTLVTVLSHSDIFCLPHKMTHKSRHTSSVLICSSLEFHSFLSGSLSGRLPPTLQGSLQRLPPSESIPGYPDPLISHHITGSSSSQPLFNSVLIICFSHEDAKM